MARQDPVAGLRGRGQEGIDRPVEPRSTEEDRTIHVLNTELGFYVKRMPSYHDDHPEPLVACPPWGSGSSDWERADAWMTTVDAVGVELFKAVDSCARLGLGRKSCRQIIWDAYERAVAFGQEPPRVAGKSGVGRF